MIINTHKDKSNNYTKTKSMHTLQEKPHHSQVDKDLKDQRLIKKRKKNILNSYRAMRIQMPKKQDRQQ